MKKIKTSYSLFIRLCCTVICTLCLLWISGCSRTDEPAAGSSDSTAEITSSSSVTSVPDETPDTQSSNPDTQGSGSSTGTTSTPAGASSAPSSSTPGGNSNSQSGNQTSQPATSAPSSSSGSSSETSQTSKPSDPPTSSTPPATSEPPATSTPQTFNIQDWVDYAIDYGIRIGLKHDEGTTGSWDNPIPASPTSKYLERDIKAGLEFAKNMNKAVYFHVWAEQRADGKYDIYIGYA